MKYHYSVDLETDTPLSVILRNVKPNSKVFEFGPADGYMTEYLKNELKCEVYCLEIDELAAAKAEMFCDKMIIADLNKTEWLEQCEDQFQYFDYLIFADVLEHLVKPEEILGNLTEKLLKDDGKVLISVPHIGHTAVILQLMQGKFEYKETGLLDRTHLTFFTRDNLEKLLLSADLSLLELHKICMLPEQTELSSSYSMVPIAIEEYLKNKTDAHVYQFVTVSEKNKSKKSDDCKDYIEKESYRFANFIQLFWNTGEGFKEQNSKRLPLQADGEYHNYVFEFKLDEGDLMSLRLDPTNFPSFANLRSFKVWGMDAVTNKLEAIENNNLVAIHDLEIEVHKDGLDLFSFGEDPQLQKDFIHENMENYKLFRVQVEMLFETKLKPQLLYNLQKRLDDLRNTNGLEEMAKMIAILQLELKTSNNLIINLFDAQNEKLEFMNQLSNELESINRKNIELELEISSLKSSFSWRITSIFRYIRSLFS
ncbi:methyltransferase domain-containing protein [Paenibacillus sp. FSL H8-0122]|uniref:class I SAM-dependent methyltransferase n=1 Tax=Paenibacillus sp. FSL H8-0122 TaxID=2954510 RepID=UPI0030F8B590